MAASMNQAVVQKIGSQSGPEAVEVFGQTINGLYEKDYGDFMRRVSLYLERMRVDLGGRSTEANKILVRMKSYLVYTPDFDIEATRIRLLRDAEEIRRLVS